MNRRNFLLRGALGSLGVRAFVGREAQALPCPPPSIQVSGGTQVSTQCGSAPGTVPAWLQGKDAFQWLPLPSTKLASVQSGFTSPGGSKMYVCSYSGGALKASGSELFVAGGGHADYAGNEVYSLRLADDTPAWVRRNSPTATVGSTSVAGSAYYSDGRPTSRHTYWHLQYCDQRDRLMTFGAAAVWGNGNGNFPTVDGFNPGTNEYDPAGTYPSQSGIEAVACGVAKDGSGNVYVHNFNSGTLFKWTQSSNTWSSLGNRGVYNYETAYACDTRRNRMLRVRGSSTSETTFDLNNGGASSSITFTGSSAGSITGGSLVYDSGADCFWFLKRGSSTLFRVDPVSWAVTVQSVTGTVPNNSYVDGRHMIYGRFAYCPELRGLVFVKDVDNDAYFIRTA